MRHHGVACTKFIFGISERVVLRSWLRVPYIASVTSELTRFDGGGYVFFDNNSTTSGINEPGA